MTIEVLDPSNEATNSQTKSAPRLATLQGKTVAIITNSKEGTKGYFSHLDHLLKAECGVAEVVWREKSNYSAPADTAIVAEMRKWDAVVAGVGD